MLSNKLCESCGKAAVCRNIDLLYKFDEAAKKQLGIDITLDSCENYEKTKKDD